MRKFDTYIPADVLKPFVRSLVISENTEEETYKVLPDTGVVLGFQYKGRLLHLENGTARPLMISGITGMQETYRMFKNTAHTGTVLVFFKEAGAAAFFREPLHELFGQSVSLDNLVLRSELLVLEERLCAALQDSKRINVVEEFLVSRLRMAVPDQLVTAALGLIHKLKGNIRVKDLASQLFTSQSALEKRFRQAVGTSPKKFASIVRLRHVLNMHHHQPSLTSLAYEAGFYDQPHFIKEFRRFTGNTPEIFFSLK